MSYELIDTGSENANIKVIGVGGGGGNAVNHMVDSNIEGVQFICANTDAQALRRLTVDTVVQLGVALTKGLGAGTNPEIGKEAAEENRERLREVMEGADMIFLTAGMGGGTGTGAIPIVAEIARELGILTVAVVTKPFDFEGKKKMMVAEKGIAALEQYVDSLITIPNQKLLPVLGADVSMANAFKAANNVLLDAVQGITELIVHPGTINVDFADVRTVMAGMGAAIMGTATATGENRARKAAEKAIACPLLDDVNLQGARGILVNISAADIGMAEFNEVGNIVAQFASEDAVIKMGTAIDTSLGDQIKVTVVATGMGKPVPASVKPSIRIVTTKTNADEVDYDELSRAMTTRTGRADMRESRFGVQSKKETEMDYDIPAFLRRQAD